MNIKISFLFLAFFLFIPVGNASSEESLRLGVLAHVSKSATIEHYQPLIHFLNSELDGIQVEVVPLGFKNNEFEEALSYKKIDMFLTNPSHYLLLKSRNPLSGVIATQIRSHKGVSYRTFGGVIVTRTDNKDINHLKDIVDKKVAIVARKSLGGFLSQAYEIQQEGGKLEAADIQELYSHHHVIDAVINHDADVGFIRSGIIENLVDKGELELNQLKIINEQKLGLYPHYLSTRLYPEWPFVVLPHIDLSTETDLARALLNYRSEKDGFIIGFGPPSNYLPVDNIARELRIPPYDFVYDLRWQDIWQKYKYVIQLTIISFVVILLLIVLLSGLTYRYRKQRELYQGVSSRLNEIIKATRIGTWEWNIQTGETKFNSFWAEMVGYTLVELEPTSIETWSKFAHQGDLKTSNRALQKHFSGELDYYDVDCRVKHKDGHWIWVNDRGKVVSWTADGQPLWMRGTHTDISVRKELEISLAQSTDRFETMVNNVPAAVYRCLCDKDWTMKYLSDYIVIICGYPAADFIDNKTRTFTSIIHEEDVDFVEKAVAEALAIKEMYELEYRIIDASNTLRWVAERGQGSFDEEGNLLWLDGSIFDITDKKIKDMEISRLAMTDELTGLTNRHHFFKDYTKELKRAARDKSPLSLLMIDIDFFKQYNDTYGHLAGDECLKQVADALNNAVHRPIDIIARYGGEEFIVMLSDTNSAGARLIADNILSAIRELKIEHNGSKVESFVTISIGSATNTPQINQDIEFLIQLADKALYTAKGSGRNRVCT